MDGFQRQVTTQPAPAVEGDFASANPRYFYLAGPGGLVAGPLGVTIARFAWAYFPDDADGAPATVSNVGNGAIPTGFVHRNQQGLITDFLATSGMVIKPGYQMSLMTSGDTWMKNSGPGVAKYGLKIYANFADGTAYADVAGNPAAGGSATGTIAAATASVTGSIADDVLTVTAVGSGILVPGGLLSGTDGTTAIATGTRIVSQQSGTAGGVGVYIVSIAEQSVNSCTVSETYGLFTAVSALSGTFGIGQPLAGSGGGGVAAGSIITGLGTGLGGLGTYYVNNTQTVTSSTITSASSVETKWYARSTAAVGELMKIDAQVQG